MFEGGDESVPCPDAWFSKTMEEVALVEQTGCSLWELKFQLPLEDRMRHLFYKRIMDKARPELERQAREKAKLEREMDEEMNG